MWQKWKLITTYEADRKFRLHCVFELLGVMLWISGPWVFSPRPDMMRLLQDNLLFRSLWQRYFAIAECRSFFVQNWYSTYIVNIPAIPDSTITRNPSYSGHNFPFSFSNLLRKDEIVSFKPCSRNWFRNLPSENKRELEMLTVILGRLLEVPDIRGTYRK